MLIYDIFEGADEGKVGVKGLIAKAGLESLHSTASFLRESLNFVLGYVLLLTYGCMWHEQGEATG